MALTLMEASKINKGDVKRSTIIEMFARASELMAAIPFVDIPGGSLSYNQEGTLPGVAFRGFNEGYSESVGVINPQTEVLRIAGGDLDVDKAIVKTLGADTRAVHESMKVKALSLHITGKLINGSSAANPREFDGLRVRIGGAQLINATGGAVANGGDPLSLEQLDTAIDAVDSPTHIIMSKDHRRKLSSAAKKTTVAGDLTWSKDDFGNRVAFYNDLPVIVADYDDIGTRIIQYNEVGPGGANATASSIYVVSFGEGMVQGLQNGVMEVTDLGEIDAKPVLRTRIEWLVGLAIMHGRAAARVWGISNAAFVA